MPSAFVLLFAAHTIAVAPLRVEHGATILELRADGTIVDAAGVEIGQVEGNDVRIGDGTLFRVDDAGAVRCAYFDDQRQFDDQDALVYMANGERRRYFVDDDGMVQNEGPSGDVHPTGVHVSGVTPATLRAAVLLAMSALILERVGPLPRPPRVTFSLDVLAALAVYFEVTTELRIDRRFSLALHAGGGSRLINVGPNHGTTIAWEAGLEPRWYLGFPRSLGNSGAYLAWSTRFAHAQTGVVGFESLQPPRGLSCGPIAGWKADFWFIVTDISAGVLFPLLTPASEVSHPPAAFVGRFGVGFTF